MAEFQLDPHSPTWAVVKTWAEKQIEAARLRLETPGLDQPTTEHQRGRIAALKELLGQTIPKPVIPASTGYDQ